MSLNLDTLRNALTETQGTLDDAHSNLAEDNDMLGLVNKVYREAIVVKRSKWHFSVITSHSQ